MLGVHKPFLGLVLLGAPHLRNQSVLLGCGTTEIEVGSHRQAANSEVCTYGFRKVVDGSSMMRHLSDVDGVGSRGDADEVVLRERGSKSARRLVLTKPATRQS